MSSEHLVRVARLVIENGGSEDEAIAALLNDPPEDQGSCAPLGHPPQLRTGRGGDRRRDSPCDSEVRAEA
jgi:hypothetical protein